MSKKLPTPPGAAEPIVVAPSLSVEEEGAFLIEFSDAFDRKDVDRAAKCVIKALDTPMERKLLDSLVATVNNLAHEHDQQSSSGCCTPSVTEALCKATDAGFHEYAYNAANHLIENAKNAKQYREAERYYKIAMGYKDNPVTMAAAHVNYCPIVRDGLISGTPDWPAAVEIYEAAARMGLVRGMVNAGKVSQWLGEKGSAEYATRAAYWFNYALEFRASKQPSLDMESLQELEESDYAFCMGALSALHIDKQFPAADLETGIRWARELAARGDSWGLNNLGVGRTNRMMLLTTQPSDSPGANWRVVLEQMDWRFKGDVQTRTLSWGAGVDRHTEKVDQLLVQLQDGTTLPLFVSHHACLPMHKGFGVMKILAQALAKKGFEQFFFMPRKALFIELDDRSCTPVYVWSGGELLQQSLWVSGSPELVLEHVRQGYEFPDERFTNWTCMLPIAVNSLDEGAVIATEVDVDRHPFVPVPEPWRMPFLDALHLLEYRILLEGGPMKREPVRPKRSRPKASRPR